MSPEHSEACLQVNASRTENATTMPKSDDEARAFVQSLLDSKFVPSAGLWFPCWSRPAPWSVPWAADTPAPVAVDAPAFTVLVSYASWSRAELEAAAAEDAKRPSLHDRVLAAYAHRILVHGYGEEHASWVLPDTDDEPTS